MNIIKIQDQLKGVPDQTLVGYVQNPTGKVPTYLALSELQRRKEMRQNYQANKPEEKTVAEDLVEETQPGLMSLPAGQPMQQAMQPPPEMPMEQMAQGGLADLDTGDMYDENNYANGGIVAFAKGGSPDEYGVVMPIVPTMDDMYMQTLEAQKAFGVDPDFYKKTLEESKTERLKELEEAKKMDQAQLLLAMGSAFAGTPTFGKALSVAGERAAPIVGAMGKTQREINNMYKMADRKSLEAQYAQARGDAAGAQKAITEKENLLLTAQLEEAKLKSAEGVAKTKASATIAGKEGDLNSKIYDKAQKDFAATFPSGSASNVFRDNPGFIQFVKNIYLKNAEAYIKEGKMPEVPTESQLLDMFNKGKTKPVAAAKPASKLSGVDSPLAATRPKNIQSILDKYPATGSRSRNTQEELDIPFDLAGQGLDDPYYQD
jgi:hypothetical protein